jgi:hypothetical protein
MRQVLQFLQWKAQFWEQRANFLQRDSNAAVQTTVDLVGDHRLLAQRLEGVKAYGLRQAYIQRALHAHFKSLWLVVPALITSQIGRDGNAISEVESHMMAELTPAASFLNQE